MFSMNFMEDGCRTVYYCPHCDKRLLPEEVSKRQSVFPPTVMAVHMDELRRRYNEDNDEEKIEA